MKKKILSQPGVLITENDTNMQLLLNLTGHFICHLNIKEKTLGTVNLTIRTAAKIQRIGKFQYTKNPALSSSRI